MNPISYNLKRHVELLKFEENANSQENYLLTEEFLELCKYSAIVEAHILWLKRFEVISVMQQFLNKEITAFEFHDRVFGLRRTHQIDSKNLISKLASEEIKDFVPNPDSKKIDGFLSALYFECEGFEVDGEEELFYNTIENGFLRLKEVLNEK